MGKTKQTLTVIGIMLTIFLVGAWAFAQGPWGGMGYGDTGRGYGYPYSNLSPEQREKLQDREQEFYQDTDQLRRELYRKRLELRSLWTDPKADPEKIKAKQREVFELESRIQDKALAHRLAIREQLPEEQYGHGPRGFGHGMGYGSHYGRGHMWRAGPGTRRGYGGRPCW